jgi:bifunctional DNase/RNase
MGGKGSGRRKMSFKETVTEIHDLLDEIQERLEATIDSMDVLDQRVRYYTETVSKRR